MSSSLFAFVSMPGPMEMLIILAIMLLLFGNRLPSVMRSLGTSAREFKKGVQGMEDEFHESSRDSSKPSPAKEDKPQV